MCYKKRVLQNRVLSKSSEKINEYITLLIENYNAIVRYTKTNTDNLSENHKALIFSKIESWRVISLKCFEKLNCNIEIPENLDLVGGEGEINMATIDQKMSYMCASMIRKTMVVIH